MKIVNINLHFYPFSYGGATVVAEKLAHGLIETGNDVINIALNLGEMTGRDFKVTETPFGPSIHINGTQARGDNRFYNPPCTSVLHEILELIAPDKIIVHAPQHMGLFDLLKTKHYLSITTIVVHDFYWACLQGFRVLPNGQKCDKEPSPANCRACAYYPGLTRQIYEDSLAILNSCQKLVFPSQFIHDAYKDIFGCKLTQGVTIQNPDMAEAIAKTNYPIESSRNTVNVAYFGGPGITKGWDIVRDLSASVTECNGKKVRFLAFDAGKINGQSWYHNIKPSNNLSYAEPFHWTQANSVLKNVDVTLMPSRVEESFGLVARETLSAGGCTVIIPSGALCEITECHNVYSSDEDNVKKGLLEAINHLGEDSSGKPIYQNMNAVEYAEAVLAR
jgi:glycosyltransferase involved in cell wall biosynthesis